jgi:hypothetical protein
MDQHDREYHADVDGQAAQQGNGIDVDFARAGLVD